MYELSRSLQLFDRRITLEWGSRTQGKETGEDTKDTETDKKDVKISYSKWSWWGQCRPVVSWSLFSFSSWNNLECGDVEVPGWQVNRDLTCHLHDGKEAGDQTVCDLFCLLLCSLLLSSFSLIFVFFTVCLLLSAFSSVFLSKISSKTQ